MTFTQTGIIPSCLNWLNNLCTNPYRHAGRRSRPFGTAGLHCQRPALAWNSSFLSSSLAKRNRKPFWNACKNQSGWRRAVALARDKKAHRKELSGVFSDSRRGKNGLYFECHLRQTRPAPRPWTNEAWLKRQRRKFIPVIPSTEFGKPNSNS